MLTTLTADDRTAARRPAVPRTASRSTSVHELIDQFANLVHAAEAAARQAAVAR